MAQATVGNKGNVPWAAWLTDYAVIRDAIAETYPDVFKDFNKRLARPGGFQKPIPARERIWKTKSGKANFLLPESLEENEDVVPSGGDILQLITIRSNGQFNTTIYNYSDRLRGIEGRRDVLLMSPYEIERRNLSEGDLVIVNTVADDGVPRQVTNLRLVCYDLPAGCCASYYPECNVLVPLWHHAKKSKVPASKSIPVRVERMEDLAASTPQNRIAERAL